ncbi:MAG: YicC family protein [Candidatus Krumholzibacteriota bacterium]|nr:YicC family protein [Candidatus Krumholzibacteriota bacterium]
MITSMTGYGKGSASLGTGEVTVEIRTVNHRFIDFSIRMPRLLSSLEKDVEKSIRRKINRGHVSVIVTLDKNFESEYTTINTNLLRKTYRELSKFAKKEKIPGEVDINTLLSLPEVFTSTVESIPEKKMKAAVESAVEKALDKCVRMRRREASVLVKEIRVQVSRIKKTTAKIEKNTPAALKKSLAKVKKRIRQMIGDSNIDKSRWEVEAALMSDRADYSEELVRLKSHLFQFMNIVRKGGEISKKLTFLLQEIHREVTTMGNKASDPEIIRDCLSIKGEVEKIREQIQNLE